MRFLLLSVASISVLIVLALLSVIVDKGSIEECTGGRIKSEADALNWGKYFVSSQIHVFKKAGFESGDEFIQAIERDPKCCSVFFDQFHIARSQGDGWNVIINSHSLGTGYEHRIEMTKCGKLVYVGGMSEK